MIVWGLYNEIGGVPQLGVRVSSEHVTAGAVALRELVPFERPKT